MSQPHRMTEPPVQAGAFLLHFARRRLALAGALSLAVIGGAGSAVASQYALKLLIDAMASGKPQYDRVWDWLALLLGLLAFESLFFRVGGLLGSRMVIGLGSDIRADLFQRLLARPWRFFHQHHSSALSGRIGAVGQAANAAVSTLIWNVTPPATDLVGSIIVLATIDWRLAGLLVVAATVMTTLLHRLGKRGFPLHYAFHHEHATVMGEIGDVLAHVLLVKSYGAAEREQRRVGARLVTEARLHGRSWAFMERLRLMHDATFWAISAGLLVVAVAQWRQGRMTTGDVVVVMTLSLRVVNGSRELALALLGFNQGLGGVTEAIDVLAAPTFSGTDEQAAAAPQRWRVRHGAVAFRGIRYSPGGRRPLFDEFDLDIPAGQRLAIVGASGAGKSTLLRLLQGLVLPDRGAVLIDGQPIAGVSEASLAAAMAVVTQEVELLHRTLRENLSYGDPQASPAAIAEAAEAAGCAEFIRALPDGLDTVVGERGITLSGGQRQRLALARALLKPAPILLLDEATSALDSASEQAVQDAILGRSAGRTVLAVAHRLSTIAAFDRVIVLRHGRIVEDGNPRELRHGFGPFALMWRTQGLGTPGGAPEAFDTGNVSSRDTLEYAARERRPVTDRQRRSIELGRPGGAETCPTCQPIRIRP